MARLSLDDGYTLKSETKETYETCAGLPVVSFQYRPALPAALTDWRYALRMARSGKDEYEATLKLLTDHLVSWDIEDAGKTAPITTETLRRVPEPILAQLITTITAWAPKSAESLGNSAGV